MKLIPLTQGYEAMVDYEDYEWLIQYKWSVHKDVNKMYAKRGHIAIFMHNDILRYHDLLIPGLECDHKDRDGLNNTKANLRVVTHSVNRANVGLYKNNTSGYRGVYYWKGKWKVMLMVNGKHIYYGLFNCKHTAARVYNKAILEHFGEGCFQNIIREGEE